MKKGFTLVELLIVIGILAILTSATILVLNPVRFFQEARDAQRFADLDSLRTVLIYTTTDQNASLESANGGSAFTCAANYGASVAGATKYITGARALAHAASTTVDGSGWVAVDFGTTPPIAKLPVDPTNTPTFNYQYACDNLNKKFELDAKLESAKYGGCQAGKLDLKDGGSANDPAGGAACAYEVGTDLTL